MHGFARQLILFTVVPVVLGCDREADPEVIISAEAAYAAGQEAFAKQDYAAASDAYMTAVQNGGLFVDLLAIAQVRRAECLARLGKYEESLTLLKDQERGSPLMAEIHLVRTFIFEKQGKALDAGQELRRARQYHPGIQKLAP